jgi:hypothetical protein
MPMEPLALGAVTRSHCAMRAGGCASADEIEPSERVTWTYNSRWPDPEERQLVQQMERMPQIEQNDALVAAALLSAAAGVIHAAVITEHLREWWAYGLFFAASALAQILWAGFVLRRPSRRLLRVGALGNAAVVMLWLATRVTGLPVGPEPWTPEAFGSLDVVASSFEIVLVALAVAVVRREAIPPRTEVRFERPPLAVFAGVVFAITYLALIGGRHH